MSEQPVPLREALRAAVDELEAAVIDLEEHRNQLVPIVDRILRRAKAETHLYALIEQVPLVFAVKAADDASSAAGHGGAVNDAHDGYEACYGF